MVYISTPQHKNQCFILKKIMLKEKLRELRVNKPISFYWSLMWSLSYIACNMIKPDLVYGTTKSLSLLGFPTFGLIMLAGLLFDVKPLLFGCGVIEVFAGVASWTGIIRWNVVWTTSYDPLAQISMALLDLVSAVFLFHYSIDQSIKY